MNGIDDRINDRAATQAEAEQLRQMALTQAQQAQAYQRERQVWKTVRQGDKWVRRPVSVDLRHITPYRTIRNAEGQWVRDIDPPLWS